MLATFLLVSLCLFAEATFPPSPRIFNGEAAEIGQFPWQIAMIGSSSEYPAYLCGGALISDQWVLTAGHCVVGAINATIYSGSNKIPTSVATIATEFFLHEEYIADSLSNDIGLIKLSQPIEFNENTKAIALAEADDALEPGTNLTVSGYGSMYQDDPTPYSDVLYYITVPTIDNLECASYYGPAIVRDSSVCTDPGEPVLSPCIGDSGAPAVANFDTDPVHVAVFSFVNAINCESHYPAGFSRTASYREWIRNVTQI